MHRVILSTNEEAREVVKGLWMIPVCSPPFSSVEEHVSRVGVKFTHLVTILSLPDTLQSTDDHSPTEKNVERIVSDLKVDLRMRAPPYQSLEECYEILQKAKSSNSVIAMKRTKAAVVVVASYLLRCTFAVSFEDAWSTLGGFYGGTDGGHGQPNAFKEFKNMLKILNSSQNESGKKFFGGLKDLFQLVRTSLKSKPKVLGARRRQGLAGFSHLPDTFTVSHFSDLPHEVQSLVLTTWALPKDKVVTHFDVVLNLLQWETRKSFHLQTSSLRKQISSPLIRTASTLFKQGATELLKRDKSNGNISALAVSGVAAYEKNLRTIIQPVDIDGSLSNTSCLSSYSNLSSINSNKTSYLNSNSNNNNTIHTQNTSRINSELEYHQKTPEELLPKTSVDPKKLYKILSQAGKGGFGVVWAARLSDSKDSKAKVAIKRVAHITEREREINFREVSFLDFCHHPNIVGYVGCYPVPNELWIAMEYMEGGTLTEASKMFCFREPQISYVAREILKGLSYLHSHGLVHRDLKSSNVMMTIQGHIKLIDFGLCTSVANGAKIKMCGSPLWMAPEMIQRRPHDTAVDIWCMGVCLLELANRTQCPIPTPRGANSHINFMFTVATEGIATPFRNDTMWSSTFKDFITQCLQFDPSQRSSAETLLEHPFIQCADSQQHISQILSCIFIQNAVASIL